MKHSDLAAFLPRASAWCPLVLSAAEPLDVLAALEHAAAHAANVPPSCSPAGVQSAAAVQRALATANPPVARVAECLLLMLLARHLDDDRPN